MIIVSETLQIAREPDCSGELRPRHRPCSYAELPLRLRPDAERNVSHSKRAQCSRLTPTSNQKRRWRLHSCPKGDLFAFNYFFYFKCGLCFVLLRGISAVQRAPGFLDPPCGDPTSVLARRRGARAACSPLSETRTKAATDVIADR